MCHGGGQGEVLYPIEGSSSSGSVAQNSLTLRMSRAKCQDAGLYVCEAAYLNTALFVATVNDTLGVQVRPGHVTMVAEPDYEHWAVNQTVTLTCSGPLGPLTSDSKIVWHWEFWDTDQQDWIPHDGSASDVTVLETNQQPCYRNGSSRLTRRLRLADSKRAYRCYVEVDGSAFPQFAGRFELGLVVAVSEDVADSYSDGVLFGAAIGAAGVVAVVVIIVVIVLTCLWNKGLLCSDDETQDRSDINADDLTSPKTRAMTTKTSTRNVALQTSLSLPHPHNHHHHPHHHTNDDDDSNVAPGYDVIDDSGEATAFGRLAEEEGEWEEGGVVSGGHVFDLASAQQQQAAAEDVLRTLLSTRHLLSWRVSGDGGYTTFLLRLSPSTHGLALPAGLQQGRWRKKNPAATAATRQDHLQRVALPQPEGMIVALPEVPSSMSGGYHYYESLRR
ncbi:uncharacterized protein LOC143291371 [Babylonia areolata]|uniref:uncharacterized protein LOC143291371 n=1 Tax=Babylonia areolata TaxID=304850 RepID=UPI003FD329BB